MIENHAIYVERERKREQDDRRVPKASKDPFSSIVWEKKSIYKYNWKTFETFHAVYRSI